MFPKQEYGRSDDYDPEDAEWISYTRVGSVFEEEHDLRSLEPHWRHRNYFERGPWKKGPAPDQ